MSTIYVHAYHLQWIFNIISQYISSYFIAKFCAPNQMVTNELKTKYMVVGNLNTFSLKLNGINLEKVSSYKYLGNIINSTRLVSSDIFKENADYLCNKARQPVFAMMNKIKNLDVPAPSVLHLYQTMIQPVPVKQWWWGKWVCFHQVCSAIRMCLCISRDWIICLLNQF